MWKYYALLAAFCAALTAIFSKIGVRDIDSDLATAVRVTFILFIVWAFALASSGWKGILQMPSRTLFFLFLSAITTGLSWLFYFRALQLGDVSRVAPVDKLSVPLAMLLAFLFLGEPVTFKVLLGGLLITAGTLILLL